MSYDYDTSRFRKQIDTGGGWQDQVGGITPGLKYITSMGWIQNYKLAKLKKRFREENGYEKLPGVEETPGKKISRNFNKLI